READLENALYVEELLADIRGLALLLLGRVLEERRAGNHDEDAVDRAVLAVAAQELQEGAPFGRVRRVFFLESEATGRVEDDGLVGDPPVAVARAPGARQGVGADRELEPGVLERGRFAGLRLADQEVPGQRIDVEAGLLQLLDRVRPLQGEIAE